MLGGAEAEAVGELHAHGADASVVEHPAEPRGVCALGQPEAATPRITETAAMSSDTGSDL